MTFASPSSSQIQKRLADEAATLAYGAELAQGVKTVGAPLVIFLHGDLGAGKTTFARGFLRGLGVIGRVKSPTYALVEVYAVSRLNLYHFDFYRLADPNEWHEAGFRDLINPHSICLIEWPERALGAGVALPPADLEIFLTPTPNDQREITLQANNARAQQMIATLHPTAS
jgi:tRNA threonylcarbamoyladenosine biosynthesis protein TsaE